jgi:hypothetical protein
MKSRLFSVVVAFFLLAVSLVAQATPPKITYSGGDGSSFEKAVVIHGASEQTGVDAEYDYLAKHFPGYHQGKQSLRSHEKHRYDVLEFTTANGATMTMYFDITEFFGKF